jgi:quinol monooxygenase YgiN
MGCQMSVARIGDVQAKQGLTEDLREFLISIMPIIKSSQGCESVQLYQSQDDPTKFTMIEVWNSVESHQASVKNIPPEKLTEIRRLLTSAPSGSYYKLVQPKSNQRKQRTSTELRKITDRLFYEWQMLTNLTQALQTVTDQSLENTFIESCAIHSRALVKFLYAPKSMPNDAIAEDLFSVSNIWTNARPTIHEDLTNENFVKFANKQIAHIIYSDEDKYKWNFIAIANAIQPALEKFIELIDKDQLGNRWSSNLNNQTGMHWEKIKLLVNSKLA